MKKKIEKRSNKTQTSLPKIFNYLGKKADKEQYNGFLDLTAIHLRHNRKINIAKSMFKNAFSKMDKDLDTMIKGYILKVCKRINKKTRISLRDAKRIVFEHLYYYFVSKREDCIKLKKKYKFDINLPLPSIASHDIAEKESENEDTILILSSREIIGADITPETKIIEK